MVRRRHSRNPKSRRAVGQRTRRCRERRRRGSRPSGTLSRGEETPRGSTRGVDRPSSRAPRRGRRRCAGNGRADPLRRNGLGPRRAAWRRANERAQRRLGADLRAQPTLGNASCPRPTAPARRLCPRERRGRLHSSFAAAPGSAPPRPPARARGGRHVARRLRLALRRYGRTAPDRLRPRVGNWSLPIRRGCRGRRRRVSRSGRRASGRRRGGGRCKGPRES
jgi:hypothetical protein